ncbi:Hypothetical predicted protein [Mytilus galloprovincialis]|uniref:Uncharacterized protein n=1 Tax=Mytilus galloprovincialis TaxID=29158 RepID=A0A8B6CNI5_MYTGA|nr:Hypothetical predicted protein [Mytilus galloprovincialis]
MMASHTGYKCIDHQERSSIISPKFQVCDCPTGRQCNSVKDEQLNDIYECSKEHNDGLNLDKKK